MTGTVRSSSGVITAMLAASIALGTVTVLGVAAVTSHFLSLRAEATPAAGPVSQTVNRDGKGDALPLSHVAQVRLAIKTVEVVGVRDAAIVYRDRDGNVLFKTDPVANVTVVTKNVDLPEVTIRETAATEVERVDAGKQDKTAKPLEAAPTSPPPHGCESAFARPSPEALTNKTSRCVTAIEAPVKVAALR